MKSKQFPLCLPEANPSSWQAGSLLLFFLTANIEKRRLTPEPSLCASQRWRILLKTNEHFSQVSWQQNGAVHAEYPHRTPCLMAWDEVSLLLLLHFLPHSKSRRESAFDQPVSLDAHKKKKENKCGREKSLVTQTCSSRGRFHLELLRQSMEWCCEFVFSHGRRL